MDTNPHENDRDIQSYIEFKITLHALEGGEWCISLNYYDNNILVKDFFEKIVPKYKISRTNKFNIHKFFELENTDIELFFIDRPKVINNLNPSER